MASATITAQQIPLVAPVEMDFDGAAFMPSLELQATGRREGEDERRCQTHVG